MPNEDLYHRKENLWENGNIARKNVGLEVSSKTTQSTFWSNQKKEISRIVKVGGKVISFGWNSGGIGMKYGFEIERILLVAHGGWHNDTICTVEKKVKNV